MDRWPPASTSRTRWEKRAVRSRFAIALRELKSSTILDTVLSPFSLAWMFSSQTSSFLRLPPPVGSMADPLSIATGILTFMGACNALASTIKKLNQLRKAPHELEALENEILALRSCAEGINQIVQMHSGARNHIISQVSVVEAIENAYKKIKQIHKYIEHDLLDTTSSSKIRPSAWLKWQSEFNRLRQELRDIRSEMGTCISLFNA